MVSHKTYSLNVDEDFVIFDFQVVTFFIDGFTSGMKSQPMAYLPGGSAHIYWI
jgi:hypothetical protein